MIDTATYSRRRIAEMKRQKREELRQSKEKLAAMAKTILEPRSTYEKADKISTYIQAGIALYDGVCMGAKLLARLRRFFGREK